MEASIGERVIPEPAPHRADRTVQIRCNGLDATPNGPGDGKIRDADTVHPGNESPARDTKH